MFLYELDEMIKLVCPIHGVSHSGRIDFKDEATIEQREAATDIFNDHINSVVTGAS